MHVLGMPVQYIFTETLASSKRFKECCSGSQSISHKCLLLASGWADESMTHSKASALL